MVFDQQHQHESQWSALSSIAQKIGCTSETLRKQARDISLFAHLKFPVYGPFQKGLVLAQDWSGITENRLLEIRPSCPKCFDDVQLLWRTWNGSMCNVYL